MYYAPTPPPPHIAGRSSAAASTLRVGVPFANELHQQNAADLRFTRDNLREYVHLCRIGDVSYGGDGGWGFWPDYGLPRNGRASRPRRPLAHEKGHLRPPLTSRAPATIVGLRNLDGIVCTNKVGRGVIRTSSSRRTRRCA